ncbi:hypothetical protein VaNZ11_008171 [Volvox africanus]|uniref:F-box domain-containing protein n=1 Tax=Volvox africanus TaxID=51714 RepID=A0ABQ5S5Q8_9CHLO|nr:hypothetical protein VaNZ11_008171 [Volvox africanus]
MTRKRSKSKGTAFDYLPGHHGNNNTDSASSLRLSSFDSLPNETLLLIFANLQFPSRQHASLVCRRWRDLLLEPPFCRYVALGQSLSEALQASSPGDTLICPPGMYQETLLMDKPVRLVADDYWRAERKHRYRRRGRDPSELGRNGAQPAAMVVEQGSKPGLDGPCSALADPDHLPQQQHPQFLQQEWVLPQEQVRQRSGGSAIRQRGGPGNGVSVRARPSVPSVTVLSLRPPVVVMDSRCCFVGFEFHTPVVHNEVSICCFGPNSPLARFEHCTFSGLTGLRVPYSKGSQTRLELYDCTLLGTTQSLAAVQMDAGRLSMIRCAVQNNSVGVEVGPEALARLADCELRWCGTALVVDGCLAMANCRLWGNGKLGNLNTDVRLRAAQSYSEACLAAGGPPPQPPQPDRQQDELLPKQAQEEGEQPPSATVSSAVSNRGRRRGQRNGGDPGGDGEPGTSTAAAAASTSGGALNALSPAVAQYFHRQTLEGNVVGSCVGASSVSPSRLAALAAAQWVEVSAAFASRQHLVRVVGCEVAAPQLIMRAGLHKEVRKKARELVRQVYGAPDDDLFPEWEVLVHSDLDSDMDDEDSSVTSGSVMADDEDLEDEDEDLLDLADDPDLDESGESQSGSDSDISSGSGSGDAADAIDYGEAASDGEAGEAEDEDEEWGVGEPLNSGLGSSDSSGDGDSRDSDSSGSGGERDSSNSGGSTEGAGGSSERDS